MTDLNKKKTVLREYTASIIQRKEFMNFYKKITILLIVFLTSCGFQPRGELPLAPPLHYLYLQTADPYGTLSHYLRDYLRASHVYLAPCPEQALVILNIIREETGQQLLSVSGTLQTRQYNLILTVTFQLTDPHGRCIMPPTVLTETRTMPVSTNQILGGSNEANTLYNQMRQSIVFSIMNRLASQQVTCLLKQI